jgi:hypothetical protein
MTRRDAPSRSGHHGGRLRFLPLSKDNAVRLAPLGLGGRSRFDDICSHWWAITRTRELRRVESRRRGDFFDGRYAHRPVYLDLEPDTLAGVATIAGVAPEHAASLKTAQAARGSQSEHLRAAWRRRGGVEPPPKIDRCLLPSARVAVPAIRDTRRRLLGYVSQLPVAVSEAGQRVEGSDLLEVALPHTLHERQAQVELDSCFA